MCQKKCFGIPCQRQLKHTIYQVGYKQIKGINHRGEKDTWSFTGCHAIAGNTEGPAGLSPRSTLLELTLVILLFL